MNLALRHTPRDMKGIPMPRTRERRLINLVGFSAFASVAVFAITFHGSTLVPIQPDAPSIRVRDFTITYYRAPEHSHPIKNRLLDPYDSFEKDADGDLVISATGTNIFSRFAKATYLGYVLKTHKGNPVMVYQETPSRRGRQKTNCHGLTFLGGDYWLLDSQVQRILDDDGWVAIRPERTQRGDVAVYRNSKGNIVHSARIVTRDDNGHVLVNSKNGFDSRVNSVLAEIAPTSPSHDSAF
jgi:hypothetical protein